MARLEKRTDEQNKFTKQTVELDRISLTAPALSSRCRCFQLHSVFVNTLATVLMGGTKTMAESVVTATRLQDRILAVVASTGGGGVARPAFFGHLWQVRAY